MTTETRLTTIVNKLKMSYINNNVDKLFGIKYCKCLTDTEDVKPIYETTYSDDDYIFKITTPSVENSIELKAVKRLDICLLVIKALDKNYNKLLLSRAEYILITRGKFPILKINNTKPQNTNIYISCDIQLLESYLETIYKDVIDEEFYIRVLVVGILAIFSGGLLIARNGFK